ncbi:histidine phosphatase family protein [Gordonia sp. CPCC 205515]|uniref:histidine phosphatase family protein n=1 Tax=Gordonia sp. CPCC 205515 TaxID=3140791 RepID=UPI003AF3C77D
MELLLIRHARPFHVTDPSGVADPQLTPDGEDQAARLGTAIAAGRYGPVHGMLSSPMRRAVQTAEPAARELALDIAVDDRLVELNHGWAEYGLASTAYTDRRALLDDMNAGRIAHRTFDPRDFQDRVIQGIDDVVNGSDQESVAIVCHGGVINAYLSHVLGAPRMFFTDPFYTSVSRLRAEPDGYREILSLNEVDHLR